MSKTVKTVTTVMMVGLVAMLGAKAEAHYTARYGKAYYCSVDVVTKLSNVPDPIDVTAQAESVVTTKKVEYRCSNGTGGQSMVPVTLTARSLIHPDPFQGITNNNTAEIVIKVSDQPLLDLFCPISSGEVLIRSISSLVINIYTQANSVLASRAAFANCTLAKKYNVLDNPPPIGTPYDCPPGSFEHLDKWLLP